MRRIKRQIVSAVLISQDKKILMGMKDPKQGGVWTDCWHIPGGGVEENEDQKHALEREVLEETGISISDAKIELIDELGTMETTKVLKETGEKVTAEMQFFVYVVHLPQFSTQLKIIPNDDLIKLEWFHKEDLPTVKLTPPSIALFSRIDLTSLFL